jgi:cytochrome P450
LLGNDPPSHTAYRRMANRAFTPRTLKWMEQSVCDVARQLVDELAPENDFIESFSIPLPVYAISAILGLGPERRAHVRRWTTAIAAPIGATLSADEWLAAERDRAEFDHVMLEELEIRRRRPAEDLLSQLVLAVDREVPEDERAALLLGLVRQLLVAGNETTTRLLPECVVFLAGHPDGWDRLRAGIPGYADAVVEESLRLSSPVQQMRRTVTRDAVLGGIELAAGSRLLVSFASANRDEAVFPDPDRFDPLRENRFRHIAFGQGIHTCLGAALARMESRIALEMLASRTAVIEPLPHEPRYLSSYLLRGRSELPVRVKR